MMLMLLFTHVFDEHLVIIVAIPRLAVKPSPRLVVGQFEKSDWYERVEAPVRELVRLLRDNGFNTISSCGHHNPCPYIEMEWYSQEEEMRGLYNLLQESGYSKFELHLFWSSDGIGRSMQVKLPDGD